MKSLCNKANPIYWFCLYGWSIWHEIVQTSDFRSSCTYLNSSKKKCEAMV